MAGVERVLRGSTRGPRVLRGPEEPKVLKLAQARGACTGVPAGCGGCDRGVCTGGVPAGFRRCPDCERVVELDGFRAHAGVCRGCELVARGRTRSMARQARLEASSTSSTRVCRVCCAEKGLELFRATSRGFLGRRSVCEACLVLAERARGDAGMGAQDVAVERQKRRSRELHAETRASLVARGLLRIDEEGRPRLIALDSLDPARLGRDPFGPEGWMRSRVKRG